MEVLDRNNGNIEKTIKILIKHTRKLDWLGKWLVEMLDKFIKKRFSLKKYNVVCSMMI